VNPAQELGRLLADWAGIEMARGGIDHSALAHVERRVRELGLPSASDYLRLLSGPKASEFQALVDAITVTYTWFFRDAPQLQAIIALLGELPAHGRPLQVWVAGCATGEDVYSLALLATELARPIEILGTDLNGRALAVAESGAYGAFAVRELPTRFSRYFVRVGKHWRIDPALRKNVRFERGNLVEAPPVAAGGGWDLILCRNVLIYFVREQAHAAFEALAGSLRRGGYLLVGSSEIVFNVPSDLEPVYIADRLAFRHGAAGARPPTAPARTNGRHSLVPSAPTARWEGPLPALPTSASEVTHPSRSDLPTPALAAAPNSPDLPDLQRAHGLLDDGALAEALELYLAAVAREPSDAEARTYAGITLYLQSNIEQAIVQLRAAILLDSNSWVATFYLALCYETNGLTELALREYRRVVALSERATRAAPSPDTLRPWHADLLALAKIRARG